MRHESHQIPLMPRYWYNTDPMHANNRTQSAQAVLQGKRDSLLRLGRKEGDCLWDLDQEMNGC